MYSKWKKLAKIIFIEVVNLPYTTRAMYNLKISILNKDKKALEYLSKKTYDDISIDKTDYVYRTVFTLSSETPKRLKKVAEDLVSTLIITYYKLQYILREIQFVLTPELVALLGTVVAFRHTEELDMVSEKLIKLNEINIDGLLNFKLVDLTREWVELGKLTNRLLSQCDTPEDVYELIAFMLGLEPVKRQELVLSSTNTISINLVEREIFDYFDNTYESTLYTMLFHRPSSIIIKEPKITDERIVECVKSLGK